MTEIYGLFDAADPMDPDRVYTAEAFARLFRAMMRDGVVHNDGDELAVSPSVPAAMSVSVGTGMALIQGRYYINDAALTLNVEAADPSHPRIDRVVVRLEATPGRTVHAVVKKGTPAPSPVPPALTRTAETWELSLAQVRVEAGATSIVAGKITDERGNVSLCGVAAPVYVPSSQMEVVGAVDMQGNALTGLPVPSAATDAARRDMGGATLQNLGAPVNPNDAARKSYVDAKVAGFGISQIAIDADKNWNGKSITNLRSIDAILIRPEASDQVRYGPKPGSMTVTIPAVYGPGTAKVTGNVDFYWSGEVGYPGYMVIKVNSVTVATVTAPDNGNHTLTKIIPITGGDVINVTGNKLNSSSLSLDDTAPISYPPSPTWPE